MDLSRAFKIVPSSKLVNNLSKMAIQGPQLSAIILENRKQFFGPFYWLNFIYGVLQGSILEPLLLIFFFLSWLKLL